MPLTFVESPAIYVADLHLWPDQVVRTGYSNRWSGVRPQQPWPSVGKPVAYMHHVDDVGIVYVGYSSNFLERQKQHAKGSAWMSKVTTILVTGYDSPDEALLNEADSISTRQPMFNRAVPGQPPMSNEIFHSNLVALFMDQWKSSPKAVPVRRTEAFGPDDLLAGHVTPD